jgi:hypothetical protein
LRVTVWSTGSLHLIIRMRCVPSCRATSTRSQAWSRIRWAVVAAPLPDAGSANPENLPDSRQTLSRFLVYVKGT